MKKSDTTTTSNWPISTRPSYLFVRLPTLYTTQLSTGKVCSLSEMSLTNVHNAHVDKGVNEISEWEASWDVDGV